MDSKMHIRKLRMLDAMKHNKENCAQNQIVVDDIHSFINKAVYGKDCSPVIQSPEVRLKQIKGLQEALHQVGITILKRIEEITLLTEASSSSCSTASQRLTQTPIDTLLNTSESFGALPIFIQRLLNTTSGDSIVLGPNGTKISKKAIIGMNWRASNAVIVRRILMEVFDRHTLATHTLSGKPSPAFVGMHKMLKAQLEPAKIEDITYFITSNFDMSERQVRQVITTKCADENKTERLRHEKRQRSA